MIEKYKDFSGWYIVMGYLPSGKIGGFFRMVTL